MQLGELATAVEHSINLKPRTHGQLQAGHRQHRCHTPLDLTRSQKVCGTAQEHYYKCHSTGGAEFQEMLLQASLRPRKSCGMGK